MANQVLMPKQGITVESCFLAEWYVKENDVVNVGTLLFSYETDKAVFDYESEYAGTILKLLYQEGDIVTVLEPVCLIGEPGEKVEVDKTESIKAASDQKPEAASTGIPAKTEVSSDKPVYSSGLASPRAKAKARKQNVDLDTIKGSGPEGRIIERDIAMKNVGTRETLAGEGGPSYTVKPLSNIRKIIGKTMMKSLQNTAQLTHTLSFDATDILAYRKQLKAMAEQQGLPNITLNDIIVFAVSRILKSYPDLNANFVDNELRVFEHAQIGIATDTPRGLMVPTLRNADLLTLSEIADQAKTLVSQCVSGSINPDLLTNASFTISNLGILDIEHFTPIINPPQTGILGVNTITTRIKTDEYGRPIFYQAMGLSLTYDHQVIDGAGASRFLKDLKEYLQDFSKKCEADQYGLIKGDER